MHCDVQLASCTHYAYKVGVLNISLLYVSVILRYAIPQVLCAYTLQKPVRLLLVAWLDSKHVATA